MNNVNIPTLRRLAWLFLPAVIVAAAFLSNFWLGSDLGKPLGWNDVVIHGVISAYCFVVIFINNRRDGMRTRRNLVLSIAFAPLVHFANMVLAFAVIFAGCVCSGRLSQIGR